MITNDYLEHYKQHNISPVRQDISDFNKHFTVRTKLYQDLGLAKTYFKGKKILEVGPGSGYNSLITSQLGPSQYVLIEPNEAAISHMKSLFNKYSLQMENIQIHNLFLEEYMSNTCFDIIICENMLPWIKNNLKVLEKIDNNIEKDGILVIGCSDEIASFFDISRRLLANILLQRTSPSTYSEKIDILVNAFSSHLDTLKGFGRLKEDWCADNLLGQAVYNVNLSVSDLIQYFQSDYSYYSMVPNIICDETWHKEVPLDTYSQNQVKISKFQNTWHNLIHYKEMSEEKSAEENNLLRELCREYFNLIQESELNYQKSDQHNLIKLLTKILESLHVKDTNNLIYKSISELITFIEDDDISIQSIATKFQYFHSAFGRGVQYVSMIKVL